MFQPIRFLVDLLRRAVAGHLPGQFAALRDQVESLRREVRAGQDAHVEAVTYLGRALQDLSDRLPDRHRRDRPTSRPRRAKSG